MTMDIGQQQELTISNAIANAHNIPTSTTTQAQGI